MEKSDKFQRPYWLEGKVYSVAQSVPELSTFVECLERTGYDELINASALYTVMAPTNTAFEEYFIQHPEYSSIDDIDTVSMRELVKMHIVLKSWSKDQLRLLNTQQGGWIDRENEDAQFSGYKRETLLKSPNKSYRVQYDLGSKPIIKTNGNMTLVAYSEYNKYAPFFYSEYMNYSNVLSSDFQFYYNRPFDAAEIYYAGAKLLSTEKDLNDDGVIDESYPAENGYVYLIDRVIDPLPSAEVFLSSTSSTAYQYTDFGNLVNEFATFTYNENATYAQEGANDGLEVDQLYDISYPSLAFNIADESTHTTPVNSIAYHNSLFAPTNEAYNTFIEDVVITGADHYSEQRNIPDVLKHTIVSAHMARWSPYYPSQAGSEGIYLNDLGEKLLPSDLSEVQALYGSNATLVGIDKVILPGMFKSIVAPLALRTTYNSFFGSIYVTGMLTVLNSMSSEFTLLAINDASFERDSLLLFDWDVDFIEDKISSYGEAWDRSQDMMVSISSNELTRLINGQVALGIPKGICRKEYLRTLTGYYVEFDNVNGTVSGGKSTVFGYNGVDVNPTPLNLDVELYEDYGNMYGTAPVNGKTYRVESWLTFPNERFSLSSLLAFGQSKFHDLIVAAGLVNTTNQRLNFLEEGEALTVLIPTDAALIAAQADTLVGDELKDFLMGHFVTGATLFTDNISRNISADNYFTKNGKRIRLGSSTPDEIDILNQDESVFYSLLENDSRTNTMYLGWDNGFDNDGSSTASKEAAGIYVVTHFINEVIPSGVTF